MESQCETFFSEELSYFWNLHWSSFTNYKPSLDLFLSYTLDYFERIGSEDIKEDDDEDKDDEIGLIGLARSYLISVG